MRFSYKSKKELFVSTPTCVFILGSSVWVFVKTKKNMKMKKKIFFTFSYTIVNNVGNMKCDLN